MTEIFGATPIIASLVIGLGGAVLALVVRLVKGDGSKALLRALETLITATLGAFLAHGFIAFMLSLGETSSTPGVTSPIAVTLTSFFFFVLPVGLINVVAHIATGEPAIGATGVLWIALIVGGAIGAMDGLWATHRWLGLGAITFVLDVTWGLAGSTNGLLLHLINFAWAGHADGPSEIRRSTHRYESGFRLKATFAFTQGAVMSNMTGAPTGGDTYRHEAIHAWQNRIVGPFFWFSDVGWMALMFFPALIVGRIKGRVADTLEWWAYYNNPWEVMAYANANPKCRDDGTDPDWLCWRWGLAYFLDILGVVLLAWIFVSLFSWAYL